MDDVVVLKRYPTRLDAEIAKSKLYSHGIMAHVRADDAGGMYPFFDSGFSDVELLVPAGNMGKAKEILEKRH